MLRRLLVAAPILIAVMAVVGLAGRSREALALAEPTDDLVNYETPHVHPIDLTPDGTTLVAVNTAAHRLEVFNVSGAAPVQTMSIPVGIDPVSVRARTDDEVWVVNHLSDTVSIVDLTRGVVVETLSTDNEPADVVFANGRAFITASEANAVNVYTLADLAVAPQRLSIAGEDPRSLAVSADGTTVYAAIFESGNGTTALAGQGSVNANDVVSRFDSPYQGQNPPPNNGSSFDPPLNPGITTPRTAMIVRENAAGRWVDDNGGDWSRFVDGNLAPLTGRVAGWDLADNDVAVIDTASLGVTYRDRLMNINMALAVNPVTDDITVVGTEATNEIRFEPNLNGNFVRVMVANLGRNAGRALADLNPHLDYSTPTVSIEQRRLSIGDPRGIAWSADGSRAFITGMGSNNVVVSQADGTRLGQFDVGQGPTGIVLGSGGRGYVINKFSASISTIDTGSLSQLSEVSFFDPTPQVIKDGRPFLYDTHLTSGTGHLSCASCHVDARTDRLAWDLGNPAGSMDQVAALDGVGRPTGGFLSVSPMKGPLLTQTLQDIMDFPSLHWRGDRADLGEFNPTFVNLMGRTSQFSAGEMQTFGNYLDTIHLPPNPYRNIDGSRPATIVLPNGQTASTTGFNSLRGANSRNNQCLSCHYRGRERNIGANSELAQAFVPPSWSPWYDRLGYWPDSATGSTTGFGYFHDGADDLGGAARTNTAERQSAMLAEIMTLEGPTSGLVGGERRQDSHAGVGQQVTINGQASAAETARLNQLLAIDNGSVHVAMVAKRSSGPQAGGFQHLGGGNFRPDRAAEPNRSTAQLLADASAGNPVTFTLVVGGTEQRLGVDIDADGILDGDEEPLAPDPATITGAVTEVDQSVIPGVKVDLFEQAADGGRGTFLGSTTTGDDGRYGFEVEPVCHVLTFVAPDGRTFNGSRWFQPSVCVDGGQTATVDAELDEIVVLDSAIGGSVTSAAGSAVQGVKIDLFLANGDGSRGQFLRSTTTDETGRYNFVVDPSCHVLTFVAPDGQTFGGSRWFQPSICVEVGQEVSDVDAVLDGPAGAELGGLVIGADGDPAVAVKIDLFAQTADGGRGAFLGFTETGSDGRYRFDVEPGCFVVTMIAPAGETFNGSRWFQPAACVEVGQTVDDVDGRLDAAATAALGGTVTTVGGSSVEGLKVTYFETSGDGSRGAFVGRVFTDTGGAFTIDVAEGCYWLVYVAPDGQQFTNGSGFFEAFRCVAAGENVTDLNATISL